MQTTNAMPYQNLQGWRPCISCIRCNLVESLFCRWAGLLLIEHSFE